MDDSLVGRYIYTAILLGSRKTEHVVVLVDCSTYSAKRVVAVGHGIRQGEFLQATGASCLNDAHISDVVRHHRIEANAHLLSFSPVNIV